MFKVNGSEWWVEGGHISPPPPFDLFIRHRERRIYKKKGESRSESAQIQSLSISILPMLAVLACRCRLLEREDLLWMITLKHLLISAVSFFCSPCLLLFRLTELKLIKEVGYLNLN